MEHRLGSPIGLARRATVRKMNPNGSLVVALDEASLTQPKIEVNATWLMPWAGQEGEFLGGKPRVGSSVYVIQGHGGLWLILGFAPSDGVFSNSNTLTQSSINSNLMSQLKDGRFLAQVKGGNRLFLDPKIGLQIGNSENYAHINPVSNIFSHNLNSKMEFTEASRYVNGIIKRDLSDNLNRNITFSTLDSQAYDNLLFSVGLDPTVTTSPLTIGVAVRNPPLVESRELFYEFAHSSKFSSFVEESNKYADPNSKSDILTNSRREMRSDALSLSLEYPNHLLEIIKGTVVDSFGNILDINRDILPIGKIDELSIKKNVDKEQAFQNIIAQLRKSIAFHFEINARKGTSSPSEVFIPDANSSTDYSRLRSRFSIDVDKEGQFKINVPSSSEIGNIPLTTRHENYSVLISKENKEINPNSFIRSDSNRDIYLESFSPNGTISLVSTDNQLDGYQTPIDRLIDTPINLGTVYHDITKTCQEFLETANYLAANLKLVNFDENNRLNTNYVPLPSIVSDKIIVSGPGANAGGRSGMINLDGFLSLNIGANTIDRQSLWFDYAGSVIGNVGRDKKGLSYAVNMDGDLIMQVGGPGIPSSFDSRFLNENSSYRNGTVDIRVLLNGQMMIFRMAPEGISIISPGTITLSSQQEIILRSNSDILMEGENIVMYAESAKRIVNRYPNDTI